jgi:AAA+ superfamily predicted ATPase
VINKLKALWHKVTTTLGYLWMLFAVGVVLFIAAITLYDIYGLVKVGGDGTKIFVTAIGRIILGLLAICSMLGLYPLSVFGAVTGFRENTLVNYFAPAQADKIMWFILVIAYWAYYGFFYCLNTGPAPRKRKTPKTHNVSQTTSTPAQPSQQTPRAQQQTPQQSSLNICKLPPAQPDRQAFNSLIGVDEAVSAIKDALELPLKHPTKVAEYRINPPKGILLWGPPGTGKTSLARATAKYFACSFYALSASELAAPLVGASEQNVRDLFADARANTPAVIFFDEIDAIGRKRDGMALNRPSDLILTMLLAEMDGFQSNDGIFIVGATNRKDVLDEALLRPGRFDRLIYVGLPNTEDRKKLWALFLQGRPTAGNIDLDYLANISKGFSPADIRAVVERASIEAAKRDAQNGGRGVWGKDVVSAAERIIMQKKLE